MSCNRKAVLFAGTTEGRLIARWLSENQIPGIICTATSYGEELLSGENLNPCLTLHHGRMDETAMDELFERYRPSIVIDATHPYACEVTKTIKKACEKFPWIRLLRCAREASDMISEDRDESEEEICYVDSTREAVKWLSHTEGNIFVSTGAKKLADFCHLDNYRERLYVRVLPAEESLRICKECGFSGRHIIAMQGPFSEEMNYVQLKEYDCRYLVTKDGGSAGGFKEKLSAAKRAGALPVVIRRPQDNGISLEEVIKQLKEWKRP